MKLTEWTNKTTNTNAMEFAYEYNKFSHNEVNKLALKKDSDVNRAQYILKQKEET